MSLAIGTLSTTTQNPVSINSLNDLEKGIKKGNIKGVENLLSSANVNQPLPSGEMPLHLAVRAGQPEMVALLLDKGADPEIKDFQNLNAVDHAFLMKDKKLVAQVLGKKVGCDLVAVHDQIKLNGSSSHVQKLKSNLQSLTAVDSTKLSSIHQFAYEGNLNLLEQYVSAANVNDLDKTGRAPIHYAILGNKIHIVDKLLALGANPHITTSQGSSLLHFAALSGSKEICQKILGLGIDPNKKNSSGHTALHFAAAEENYHEIEMLVKAGANPHELNAHGLSPLGILAVSAHERDPLSLPASQMWVFVCSSLLWGVLQAANRGWFGEDEKAIESAQMYVTGAEVLLNISQTVIIISSFNKGWKRAFAAIGFVAVGTINPILPQVCRTWSVCSSAFTGLRNCWRNVGYRNWAAARNTVVHSVNIGTQACLLYAHVYQAYLEYIKTLPWYQEYLKKNAEAFAKANAAPVIIDPVQLQNLTPAERILYPDLNPEKSVEHALYIINPKYTLAQLEEQGESLYKKDFRTLSRQFHSDKTESNENDDVIQRLTMANAALKKYLHPKKEAGVETA